MKESDRMSEISKYMKKQLSSLISQIGTAGGKARLARLRHGAGKAPGEIPELWGEFLNGIPENMLSPNGEPSYAEWAMYLALTMYALHQHGNGESVHSEGMTLGKATAKLMTENTDDERERVLRRFGPVITAKDMPELSHHLRCLIQLIASKGIRLDYIQLADDIYLFQFNSERKKIQLKWGQDFYYNKGEDE